VYERLDSQLREESFEFTSDYKIIDGKFVFKHPFSWAAGGHGKVEATPVFVQVMDSAGGFVQKTSNLLQEFLVYQKGVTEETFGSTSLNGKPIRQYQVPIFGKNKLLLGTIIVAIPLREATMVLQNLLMVLIVSYPIFLLALFVISRTFAGKTIEPINELIAMAERITKENLSERVPLPKHKDEIYLLSKNINELLSRLEEALLREKQFTADASHELRTPLSIIQGTLEVLIRKQRAPEQYTAKIKDVINETKRMSELLEQLLFLARYESSTVSVFAQPIDGEQLIADLKHRFESILMQKNITFTCHCDKALPLKAEPSMLLIMLSNLISNAITYTNFGGVISLTFTKVADTPAVVIADNGIGMREEDVKNIFNRFYRAESSRNRNINGVGLGLSIVHKLAELQNISLDIKSTPKVGTTVTLLFG